VLDKHAAIVAERQARADARALRVLAAQATAAAEYATAAAAAQAADDPPPLVPAPAPVPAPGPTPAADDSGRGGDGGNGDGGGGGDRPVPNHDDDPLYVKLDNIATCESGQNPRAYNPQGPWYGAFQFRADTWRSWGGGPGDIRNYSYNRQRAVAANLAQARGFAGSWPTCAARYGYT
jgi:hypothetical protein